MPGIDLLIATEQDQAYPQWDCKECPGYIQLSQGQASVIHKKAMFYF